MNAKKSLESRIRGWFPSTPNLPHQQDRTPRLQNTKAVANPLPPLLENKFQRNGGIVIGMGIGLLLIGAVGALITSQTYGEVKTFLSYDGVTNNYVLNDLIQQITIYLTIIVAGAVAVFWGGLALRSKFFREVSLNKGPNARLGNGLIGGGGALALFSFRSLFSYFLTSKFIELELFIPMFIIGAVLVGCGFLALRSKG
jgi:hypothetical protein